MESLSDNTLDQPGDAPPALCSGSATITGPALFPLRVPAPQEDPQVAGWSLAGCLVWPMHGVSEILTVIEVGHSSHT